MSSYLELVQKAARESGVFPTVPTAVAGQSGKNLRIVNHVADAWTWVQRRHRSWRWMRAEFSGSISSGDNNYSASDFGISSRFGRWITDDLVDGYLPMSIYLASDSTAADEGALRQVSWEVWRTRWGRGTHDNAKPTEYAIGPDNAFRPGATPDDTYTVNGEYQKSAQTLSADADEPECPADFHDVITWKALLLYAEYDEAPMHIARAIRNYEIMMDELERDQLAELRIAGTPLA